MKVVVTGGAGFIGSHIIEALVGAGHEVKVIDKLSSGKIGNLKSVIDQIKFVEGDIRDLDLLRKEFQGYDAVSHQAALIQVAKSIENPLETNEVNVGGTLKVLLAARDSRIRRVIFASSCAVYGADYGADTEVKEDSQLNPKSPYAVSKLIGEEYCKFFSRMYGIDAVILRYFNVYGGGQPSDTAYGAVVPNFISAIRHNEQAVIFGDGHQERDFIYVKDVAQANLAALDYKGESAGIFNIGSGKSTSVLDLYQSINKAFGKNTNPKFEQERAGDVRRICANTERAINLLRFKPKYDLETGIREVCSKF